MIPYSLVVYLIFCAKVHISLRMAKRIVVFSLRGWEKIQAYKLKDALDFE